MQVQHFIQGFQGNLKQGILIDPALILAGTVSQILRLCVAFLPWGFDTTDERIDTLWFTWIPDGVWMNPWALDYVRLQSTSTSFC